MFIILSVLTLVPLIGGFAYYAYQSFKKDRLIEELRYEVMQADTEAFVAQRRVHKAEEKLADANICIEMLSNDGHLKSADILGKRRPAPEVVTVVKMNGTMTTLDRDKFEAEWRAMAMAPAVQPLVTLGDPPKIEPKVLERI